MDTGSTLENNLFVDFLTRRTLVKMAVRHIKHLAVVAGVIACSVASHVQAQSTTPCVQNTGTGWATQAMSKDQLAAWVRPADCAWVTQSPPDFGWPDISSDAKYQVTLNYPNGTSKTVAAAQNWLSWPEALPAGTYSWTIVSTSAAGTQTSIVRRFIVDPASTNFVVPDGTTLYNRAVAKAHPRGLPDVATLTTMTNQRQTAIKAVTSEADGYIGKAPQTEPTSTSAGTNASALHNECKRTLVVGLAYVFTKNQKYLTEATTRIKNLASWNPDGTTSYKVAGMDVGARELTWTVALIYDWIWPQLDSATRTQISTMLTKRTAVMYSDVIGTRSRVSKYPRDSHANLTVMMVASIGILLAGEVPDAKNWLTNALPQAINALSPWGDGDGGYANGTAYGTWDLGDTLLPMYIWRWGIGVDTAQKQWVRNWARYMAYMLPPGTPAGAFGDSAESNLKENWARFGKAYTYFSPSPLGRWYASQLTGEDASRMEIILAPPSDFTTATFPAGTPNSAVFRGIGWAAFHSDLTNPARTSVYFRSSQYGSYNHGHGDQNSFIINSGGQKLAIDSGYYDGYKTAHWLNWYKQTKAHNAITFDGGVGQLVFETNNVIGKGQITGYTRGADYEIVYGDATHSYGSALTKAKRALVYLTPNLILVYDDLASTTARQWEWNIHALNQMTSASGTNAKIVNGTQSLCVDILAGPTTAFRQTSAFTSNPTSGAAQWHGTFYSTTKLPTTEFVTLMNVGCVVDSKTPMPTATRSDPTTWSVKVAGKTINIANGVVTMAGQTTTESTPPPTTSTPPPVTAAPPPPPPPPPPVKSKPYTGTAIVIPGTFEAENFDLGGEGVGYHDLTKGSTGNLFRTTEDIDFGTSCDTAGGGYVVNSLQTGEWMVYTINVSKTGKYDIAAKVANNYATGAFHIEIDGSDVTGSVTPVKTGNWCTFQWFGRTGISLTAGAHVLKFFVDKEYLNVNQIRVIASP